MPLGLRALVEDGRWQFLTLHLGEVHAALFKDPARLHHPGATASPLSPVPAFLLESPVLIELLQPGANGILQPHQQLPRPTPGRGRGRLVAEGGGH